MSNSDTVLHDNLHGVQVRIAAACAASARSANSVQLLAVSKTFSADDVRQHVAARGARAGLPVDAAITSGWPRRTGLLQNELAR